MANYLSLTNQVLDNLRWDSISQAEFSSPPDPAPAVKRFINQAKDEVLARIGGRLIEKEFLFETNRAITYATSGPILVIGSGSGNAQIFAADPLFDSDWMVGAKISFPSTVYNQTALPTGAGLSDPTWRRIVSIQSNMAATLDTEFTSESTHSNDWTIFRDEYDLDATVRQVLSVWTNNGPLALDFVSNVAELEMLYPGHATVSSPERCAIYRSETSGSIWAMRLYPAPEEREVIRYRAKYRLPDLSAYSDSWSLEPEIEAMIVDQATVKAVQTPIQNDPDLANVLGTDVRRRAIEWKQEYTPSDPNRRLRRQTPGSTGVPFRRIRTQVENA